MLNKKCFVYKFIVLVERAKLRKVCPRVNKKIKVTFQNKKTIHQCDIPVKSNSVFPNIFSFITTLYLLHH